MTFTSAQIAFAVVGAICGYAIGSINPAAIIARAKGVDLHGGSGNPGATNAARLMGKRTGIIVAVLDILKGLIPVLVFSAIAGPGVAEIAGFFAVVGHITSPFLKGKGGKGVATMAGVLLGAYPLWLIPVLICFGIGFLISHRMGIASVFGSIALVVTAIVDHHDIELSIFGVLLGLLILVRHQRNIRAAYTDFRNRKKTVEPT